MFFSTGIVLVTAASDGLMVSSACSHLCHEARVFIVWYVNHCTSATGGQRGIQTRWKGHHSIIEEALTTLYSCINVCFTNESEWASFLPTWRHLSVMSATRICDRLLLQPIEWESCSRESRRGEALWSMSWCYGAILPFIANQWFSQGHLTLFYMPRPCFCFYMW